MYILAFTPKKLDPENLKATAKVAEDMLKAKNATFKQLVEQMPPHTRIEIANIKHVPLMHSPQIMQTTLMGWLKNSYQLAYNPTVDKNFFPHGMKDQQGKENFILFYFDLG